MYWYETVIAFHLALAPIFDILLMVGIHRVAIMRSNFISPYHAISARDMRCDILARLLDGIWQLFYLCWISGRRRAMAVVRPGGDKFHRADFHDIYRSITPSASVVSTRRLLLMAHTLIYENKLSFWNISRSLHQVKYYLHRRSFSFRRRIFHIILVNWHIDFWQISILAGSCKPWGWCNSWPFDPLR